MCVWHIRVLREHDAPAMVDAAIAGNQEAASLLAACGNLARQINALTEPDSAVLSCLCCDAPLWRNNLPMALVLMSIYDDDASAPDAFAICPHCFNKHHADRSALASAVLAGCSARLGEPLRQLPPVAAAGHA